MSSKQKHRPDSLFCQTCANEERCAAGKNTCGGWDPLPFTLIGMLLNSQKEVAELEKKLKEARAGK